MEANLFFQLISSLYENTSVGITSNKGFDGWADIICDSVLTTALLDRLTHRCQALSYTGGGWRVAHRRDFYWPKLGDFYLIVTEEFMLDGPEYAKKRRRRPPKRPLGITKKTFP